MREVQTHHIYPGAQNRFQHFRRIGSRAKGGDDAGMAALRVVCGHKMRMTSLSNGCRNATTATRCVTRSAND
jgi:hypothetical protein